MGKPLFSALFGNDTLIFAEIHGILNMYKFTSQENYEMENKNQIPERWYSTKEMCEYLGVTRDTLAVWINEKGMPAHKVGRGWKYKPSEVDAWIKSGKAAD